MADAPQSFSNHARMRPGYHFVASPLTLVGLVWAGVLAVREPTSDHGLLLLLALTLFLTLIWARVLPLGVQDRLIRLEERLRLERLLPPEERGCIDRLSTDQIIGIRFASDEEAPELVKRVLDEGVTSRKAVKQLVRGWRADHHRI